MAEPTDDTGFSLQAGEADDMLARLKERVGGAVASVSESEHQNLEIREPSPMAPVPGTNSNRAAPGSASAPLPHFTRSRPRPPPQSTKPLSQRMSVVPGTTIAPIGGAEISGDDDGRKPAGSGPPASPSTSGGKPLAESGSHNRRNTSTRVPPSAPAPSVSVTGSPPTSPKLKGGPSPRVGAGATSPPRSNPVPPLSAPANDEKRAKIANALAQWGGDGDEKEKEKEKPKSARKGGNSGSAGGSGTTKKMTRRRSSKDLNALKQVSRTPSNPGGMTPAIAPPAPPPPPPARELTWEGFEERYNSPEVQNDPLFAKLFQFPPSDIEASSFPRQKTTMEPNVPSTTPDRWTRVCSNSYTDEWTIVRLRSEEEAAKKRFVGGIGGGSSIASPRGAIPSGLHSTAPSSLSPRDGDSGTPDGSDASSSSSKAKLTLTIPAGAIPHPSASPRTNVSASHTDLDMTLLTANASDLAVSRAQESIDATPRSVGEGGLFHAVTVAPELLPETPFVKQPFLSVPGLRLHVVCRSLKFDLGDLEPFFCSLTLYDVTCNRKLSEDFLFDANSEEIMSDLENCSQTKHADRSPETRSRECIISYSEPTHAGIYIILRVSKLLRGELDKDLSTYQKPKSVKPKDLDRMKKETREMFDQESPSIQPFVWGAMPLIDASTGEPVTGEQIMDELRPLSARAGHSTLESLCELLTNEKELRKVKAVPGRFSLAVTQCPTQKDYVAVPRRLSRSNLMRMAPWPEDGGVGEGGGHQLVKELQEFTSDKNPMMAFQNELYVYIETVALKAHHANLQVHVSIRENDGDPKADGLPLIYNTHPARQNFGVAGRSRVIFHDKRPTLDDEMKIRLPTHLVPNKHHLVLSYYHVNPNPRREKKPPIQILGYSVLPLFEGGRILRDDRHSLPVVIPELLPGYLKMMGSNDATIKWMENKKPLVQVRTRLVSSIFPQDDALMIFANGINEADSAKSDQSNLNDWDFLMGSSLRDAVVSVPSIQPRTCMLFFPVLFTELLNVMCTATSATLAKEAFVGLVAVLKNVKKESDEKTSQVSQLVSYTRFMFKNLDNSGEEGVKYPYEVITENWLQCLQQRHACVSGFQLNWFLLELIHKSMALKVHALCQDGEETNRATWFPAAFVANLKRLVFVVFTTTDMQSLDSLTTFPMFIKHLFGVMNRGVVFDMIYQYIQYLSKDISNVFAATVKFTFIKTITNCDYYIQLNIPVPVSITNVANVQDEFLQNHFLAGLICNQAAACLTQKKNIRTHAIVTLRNLLRRHDTDPRISGSRETRERVLGIYFPFVITMLEKFDFVRRNLEGAENDWLLCCLHVLKNCSPQMATDWWMKETQKRQQIFLNLLAHCVATFHGESPEVEVCHIVTRQLMHVSIDFRKELERPSCPLLEPFFDVVQHLFHSRQVSVLVGLYSQLVVTIITNMSGTLFAEQSSSLHCQTLCLDVLRHCNTPEAQVRSLASSSFYLMLRQNFRASGNLARMEVQSTVAISKLVGDPFLKDYTFLMSSLKAVDEHAKCATADGSEDSESGGGFVVAVSSMISQLFELIEYNKKIAENSFDPELTADLYVKISNSYFNSPNLRVTWLENLSAVHTKNEHFAEAAQAKIAMARLVVMLMLDKNQRPPLTLASFKTISPTVVKQKGLPDKSSAEENLFEATEIWSTEGLIQLLKDASDLNEKAQLYELCIELYSMLVHCYKKENNYTELLKCLDEYRSVTEKLMESNKDLRLLSRYYRVGFYGKLAEDLDGKEFIYREPSKVNLPVMATRLKEIFTRTVGGDADKMVLLGHNKPIDRADLDPNKLYLQLASVDPYFDLVDENSARVTAFDRDFNTSRFICEVAWMEGSKKAHGDLSSQQKKKIIFSAEDSFPSMKNRLEVVHTEEIILSPLENAIELIEDRVARLRLELEANPPRMNSLQQVIQGSVVPMVNAGPVAICDIFLANDAVASVPQSDHRHHILLDRLREALNNFTVLCGFAIALNKSIIGPKHLPFQEMVEKYYATMKRDIKKFIDLDPSQAMNSQAKLQRSISTSPAAPASAVAVSAVAADGGDELSVDA
eukprot:TRINITY_DN1431_c0_g1_i1.p1 TRINITY_DN1431_c0_g1~~TRINITY_DN1431_c0_g1_i1.p1  ORF type:complete len:2060 (+),score=630.15 TRINITY_DN1431_c0_g1_i1:204-6383(+)